MSAIFKILLALTVSFPILNSCMEAGPATTDQQTFISEFNALIDQVTVPMSSAEINARFFSSGARLSASNYILFGENHVDLPTLIDQARAMQTLLQPDDVILMEGNNAGLPADCIYSTIFTVYAVKKWNQLNVPYDSDKFDQFRIGLRHFFNETFASLNLNKLNFRGVRCFFWDNARALDLPVNNFSLTSRNSSMVSELSAVSGNVYSHVFVKAGARHLPSGDLDFFRHFYRSLSFTLLSYYSLSVNQLLALSLANFYPTLAVTQSNAALKDISAFGFGSTQPIYNYLLFRNYTELIPTSLVKASQTCDLACD